MITKIILSISLILVTVTAISWSKATPEEDLCLLKSKYELIQPSQEDNLLTASTQLLKFASNGLQELTLTYAKGGKSISQQLLKNNEILNSKSDKILEFKQNLTKFEEIYSACDGLDALFDLAEFYSNTTSYYFELEETSLDNDAKLILSLLRKYKSEDLDNEFEKHFDVFVEKFNKKFESLKENLSKEENKLSKRLLEWFARFKTLTIYDDKILAFEEFFKLYE